MKKFIIVISVFLMNGIYAFACLPFPGMETIKKNNLILNVANHYYADILNSKVEVQNYKHDYQWRFTDPGHMCHDTNVISTDMTIEFFSPFGEKCFVSLTINQTSGPEVKGGEIKTVLDIKETAKNCQNY